MTYELSGKRVWVAGHRGMVGQALVRRLQRDNCEVLQVGRDRLDLKDGSAVEAWMKRERPDALFLAAAVVGGIHANNSHPVKFLYDNLMIELTVLNGAFEAGVEKVVFLGSSCIYPRLAEQPIREDSLMTGPLEPTNEWYAIAKIAGISLARAYRREHGSDFISAMPTNLYGPHDNFDLDSSHVLPALIAKAHAAKLAGEDGIEIWGTGTPLREFMHVDDCADALVHLAMHYSGESHVNVGVGEDLSIADLARLICDVVGLPGDLRLKSDMPDGTPRKLLDCSKLRDLGWEPSIPLREGIEHTYRWYLENVATA